MLRTGVLAERTIALAGAPEALAAHLEALGARTLPGPPTDPTLDPPSVDRPRPARSPSTPSGDGGRVDVLVADARSAFAEAGGGYPGVRAAGDLAFATARDVAVEHWIERPGGGKVVLVAPAPGAGRHATAARAALENLVRTLGTEWARHAVTTVAVLPGDATGEPALADLVAWLASPAGAYVSGTALTLDR